MPLYLDIHYKVEGMTSAGIEEAHQKDLEVQHKYGVRYLKYWYDLNTGRAFCLIEAPSKAAAEAARAWYDRG
ncbi:MAG: DUF4242 domain-containing protein [Anaerolineae bacterium]